MTDSQEELIHRISEIMIKRYEKQISRYMAELKQRGHANDKEKKACKANKLYYLFCYRLVTIPTTVYEMYYISLVFKRGCFCP